LYSIFIVFYLYLWHIQYQCVLIYWTNKWMNVSSRWTVSFWIITLLQRDSPFFLWSCRQTHWQRTALRLISLNRASTRKELSHAHTWEGTGALSPRSGYIPATSCRWRSETTQWISIKFCMVGLHFKLQGQFNFCLFRYNKISFFHKPQIELYQFFYVGKIQATEIKFLRTVSRCIKLDENRNEAVRNALSNCKNRWLQRKLVNLH
jgi:hypothetical protein